MEFCPKCGGLMLPQKVEEGLILVCGGCGHAVEATKPEEYKLVEVLEGREEPAVVEEIPKTLPTTRTRCPGCGHGLAYWWIRQTRAGDEPPTRFYRCAKCGHTWREYA